MADSRALRFGLAVLLSAGWSQVAEAQQAPEGAQPVDAHALTAEGSQHLRLGEYAQAIAAFKQAYRISKDPMLLFQIAESYRLGGDCTTAALFYNNYLNKVPNPPNLEQLEAAMTGCTDSMRPAAPPPPPPPMPPPTAAALSAPAPTAWSPQRTWALVAGGAGVVGLAVGTGFALQAQSKWNDAQARCPNNICANPADVSLPDDVRRTGNVATAGFVIGGLGLVTGAILWLTAPAAESTRASTRFRVAPVVSSDSVGLMVGGRM